MGMENVGALIFCYNTISFTDNTLNCSCDMQWISIHADRAILAENYCDRNEAFKPLTYFKPIGCPSMSTTPETSDIDSKPIASGIFFESSNSVAKAVSLSTLPMTSPVSLMLVLFVFFQIPSEIFHL